VYEEHAQIAVAVLGDPAHTTRSTRRVFSGCEPEVGGEVAAGSEPVRIADERDEGGGGEHADPRVWS